MTRGQRAAQIWAVLSVSARQRQVLSYDLLAKATGVPRAGLGQLLEPIQSYCILKKLPALTSLVVSEKTGLPGEGFIAASDVPREQAIVFAHEWLGGPVPTDEDLEAAAKALPSNGRSLQDLLQARAG